MELDERRLAWVDYAKGRMVGPGGGASWMGAFVAFAKPFRMPDFFLISGLFLAWAIDRDWHDYLDRKVWHFAYFYVLWVTIQFAFKAPGFAAEQGWPGVLEQYFLSFIQPFGTLWFIYLLPIFFVVTKATRDVPPVMVWFVAALLQIADVHTGSTVVDEFAARFVYFYSGYALAPYVFAFAATVIAHKRGAAWFLLGWALFEALMVMSGTSAMPVVGLGLAFSVRARWSRWRRSSPRGTGRIPSAMPARIRSSSISPSSCPWRPRGRRCSHSRPISISG